MPSTRPSTRSAGRGGGAVGSRPIRSTRIHPNNQQRTRTHRSSSVSSSVSDLASENQMVEDDRDPEELGETDDDEGPSIRASLPTKKAQYEKPTLENYERLATQWEESYIDELLVQRDRKVHNRPPPSVIAEGEARQHQYRVFRKLLSLVGHVSLSTFNAHLYVSVNLRYFIPSRLE